MITSAIRFICAVWVLPGCTFMTAGDLVFSLLETEHFILARSHETHKCSKQLPLLWKEVWWL